MRRTRDFPAKTLMPADTVRFVGPPSFGWSLECGLHRESVIGPKRTSENVGSISAIGVRGDIRWAPENFSGLPQADNESTFLLLFMAIQRG